MRRQQISVPRRKKVPISDLFSYSASADMVTRVIYFNLQLFIHGKWWTTLVVSDRKNKCNENTILLLYNVFVSSNPFRTHHGWESTQEANCV